MRTRILLSEVPKWYISDHHFCHGNIRTYCPWRQEWSEGTSDMNRKMVEAWNEVVQPEDCVLHLGDFALGKVETLGKFRSKLNGRIIILRGNHDPSHSTLKRAGFDDTANGVEFRLPDNRIVIARHSPHHFEEEETFLADILLHGHLHGSGNYNMSHPAVPSKAIDLSLDAVESVKPLPLEFIENYHERHI